MTDEINLINSDNSTPLIVTHNNADRNWASFIAIQSSTGETLWEASRVDGKLTFTYNEAYLAEAGNRLLESWIIIIGTPAEQAEFQRELRRLLRAALEDGTNRGETDGE